MPGNLKFPLAITPITNMLALYYKIRNNTTTKLQSNIYARLYILTNSLVVPIHLKPK